MFEIIAIIALVLLFAVGGAVYAFKRRKYIERKEAAAAAALDAVRQDIKGKL